MSAEIAEARLSLPPLPGKESTTRGMIRAGIVLACTIAGAGFSLRQLPWMTLFSPMILAVLVGMVFSNTVGVAANAKAGIAFSQKTLLRAAIVVLGFQLTAAQVLSNLPPDDVAEARMILVNLQRHSVPWKPQGWHNLRPSRERFPAAGFGRVLPAQIPGCAPLLPLLLVRLAREVVELDRRVRD